MWQVRSFVFLSKRRTGQLTLRAETGSLVPQTLGDFVRENHPWSLLSVLHLTPASSGLARLNMLLR